MSFARYKPLYVSLFTSHTGYDPITRITTYNPLITTTSTIRAAIHENYSQPVVAKASDYLVAIERLEVSLNAIPFYDASDLEYIVIQSRLDLSKSYNVLVDSNAYSLSHLFEVLEDLIYKDPNTDTEFEITFAVDKDGFIILTLPTGYAFNRFEFRFPRKLNMILGIAIEDQLNDNTADVAASSLPRIDLGDELDHIIVRTNLPTYTDTLGNVKTNVMTDFVVPTLYSSTMTFAGDGTLIRGSFTGNIRQKAIYVPSERRYLELVGDFPINQIDVDCVYVDPSHVVKDVYLPFGGVFEVKLGFYLKA